MMPMSTSAPHYFLWFLQKFCSFCFAPVQPFVHRTLTHPSHDWLSMHARIGQLFWADERCKVFLPVNNGSPSWWSLPSLTRQLNVMVVVGFPATYCDPISFPALVGVAAILYYTMPQKQPFCAHSTFSMCSTAQKGWWSLAVSFSQMPLFVSNTWYSDIFCHGTWTPTIIVGFFYESVSSFFLFYTTKPLLFLW